jgi:hypothetical protein
MTGGRVKSILSRENHGEFIFYSWFLTFKENIKTFFNIRAAKARLALRLV